MDRQKLIVFFLEFWGIPFDKINDNLALNSEDIKNFSSIKFYEFFAELESKFNVKVKNINEISKFGDISKNLESNS